MREKIFKCFSNKMILKYTLTGLCKYIELSMFSSLQLEMRKCFHRTKKGTKECYPPPPFPCSNITVFFNVDAFCVNLLLVCRLLRLRIHCQFIGTWSFPFSFHFPSKKFHCISYQQLLVYPYHTVPQLFHDYSSVSIV